MRVFNHHPTAESIDQQLDASTLEQIKLQIEARLVQDPNAFDPDGPTRIVGTSLKALQRVKAMLLNGSAE